MRKRSQALVGVLSGMAVLALTALPAAANSVNVEIESGEVRALDFFTNDELAVIPLGDGSGESCGGASTVTATGTTSGTVDVAINTESELLNPFGDNVDYYVDLDADFDGTYASSGGTITIDDGTAVADMYTLAGACTPGTLVCTVTAINFTGGGGMTSGTMPTLSSGNTASISMANPGLFDTAASGSSCGGFGQLDLAILEVDANLLVQ